MPQVSKLQARSSQRPVFVVVVVLMACELIKVSVLLKGCLKTKRNT